VGLATPGEGRGDATTRRVLCAEARGLRDASVDAAHSATTKERQLDSFRYTNRSCLEERVESRRVGRRVCFRHGVYGIKLSEACLCAAPPPLETTEDSAARTRPPEGAVTRLILCVHVSLFRIRAIPCLLACAMHVRQWFSPASAHSQGAQLRAPSSRGRTFGSTAWHGDGVRHARAALQARQLYA
jgi:hypothetical protein